MKSLYYSSINVIFFALIISLGFFAYCAALQPHTTLPTHPLAQHPETRKALQIAQLTVARATWQTGIEDQSAIAELIDEQIETFKSSITKLQSNLPQKHDFAQEDAYIIKKITWQKPEQATAMALSHLNTRLKEYAALYPDNPLPFWAWERNFLNQIPTIKNMVTQNLAKQEERITAAREALQQAFPQKQALINALNPSTPYNPTIRELLEDISQGKPHTYIRILAVLADVIYEQEQDLETLVKIMSLQRQKKKAEAERCASAYAAARFTGYDKLDYIPKKMLARWGQALCNKIPAGQAREAFRTKMEALISPAQEKDPDR